MELEPFSIYTWLLTKYGLFCASLYSLVLNRNKERMKVKSHVVQRVADADYVHSDTAEMI